MSIYQQYTCLATCFELCFPSVSLSSLLSSPPVSAAFGFCEYKEPESTLRALRLLHELLLGDKKLLVKVDAKTKAQLDEWKAKRRVPMGFVVF